MATSRRIVVGLAAAAVLAVVILAVLRPGPAAQAEALFARIAGHIEAREFGALVGETDPDYAPLEHFPQLARIGALADSRSAGTDADREAVLRATLRKQGNLYGLKTREREAPTVSVTLHEVGTPDEQGVFPATVTLNIDGVRPLPSLTRHRFQLITHGWLRPTARVRSHDPIRLN